MSSSKGIGEDRVLEALKLARRNVSDADSVSDVDGLAGWNFNDWQRCTCGHIYKATGHSDTDLNSIVSPERVNGLYEETMIAVARANCDEAFVESLSNEVNRGMTLSCAISDATTIIGADAAGKDAGIYEMLPDYNERQRQAALFLIDNTISMIEAEHEKARQEILEVAKYATPAEPVGV